MNTMVSNPASFQKPRVKPRRPSWLNKFNQNFTLIMLSVLSTIIICGFAYSVDKTFIHPKKAPIILLYIHSALSTAWLGLLILQSSLVRTRNIAIHRRIGNYGMILAIILTVLGLWTSVVTRHEHFLERGPSATPGMAVAFGGIGISFAIPMALAYFWRFKRGWHVRLIMQATIIALLPAAIVRYPWGFIQYNHIALMQKYLSIPMLMTILFCAIVALQDLLANRRMHPAYSVGLPVGLAAKVFYTYLSVDSPVWWQTFTLWLAG